MHSGHIAKLDRTSKVPDCTTCFQAVGCIPHTFAANALSHPFRLVIPTSSCVFLCGGHFAAVAVSLQNLFRCTTSFAAESLSH